MCSAEARTREGRWRGRLLICRHLNKLLLFRIIGLIKQIIDPTSPSWKILQEEEYPLNVIHQFIPYRHQRRTRSISAVVVESLKSFFERARVSGVGRWRHLNLMPISTLLL